MNTPRLETYCDNTTAINALRLEMGELTLWYSYRTIVAFRKGWGGPLIVRQNDWGPTTGKHLNAIDGGDKAARVEGYKFGVMLQEATKQNEAE